MSFRSQSGFGPWFARRLFVTGFCAPSTWHSCIWSYQHSLPSSPAETMQSGCKCREGDVLILQPSVSGIQAAAPSASILPEHRQPPASDPDGPEAFYDYSLAAVRPEPPQAPNFTMMLNPRADSIAGGDAPVRPLYQPTAQDYFRSQTQDFPLD